MSEVLNAIRSRRSIRSFKPDPVPRELIDQVVEAGLYAPSGMGQQEVIIVAVTNKELRDRLSAANREIGGFPDNLDPFYGAPAVLIVLGNKAQGTYLYDGSLALGNMLLAAHALGLGGIWIHRAKEEFEQPEWKELLAQLGVTGDYEGIGHLALGYAAGDLPEPAPRKPGRVYYAE